MGRPGTEVREVDRPGTGVRGTEVREGVDATARETAGVAGATEAAGRGRPEADEAAADEDRATGHGAAGSARSRAGDDS